MRELTATMRAAEALLDGAREVCGESRAEQVSHSRGQNLTVLAPTVGSQVTNRLRSTSVPVVGMEALRIGETDEIDNVGASAFEDELALRTRMGERERDCLALARACHCRLENCPLRARKLSAVGAGDL
jgi:hypothetical protein